MEVFTFAHHDTPVGALTSVCSPRGLVRVEFGHSRIDGAVLAGHGVVDKQLREYFAGARRFFDLPLDWGGEGFRARAQRALLDIPYGGTATYAELAAMAGNGRAARAAGSACATNPLPVVVPCHRVVPAGGGLGSYAGGVDIKRQLLELEERYG